MSARTVTGLVVALLLLCAAAEVARAGGGTDTGYYGKMMFGSQLLHLSDGCLSVEGTVESGTFFSELQRKASNGQIEYRKRGESVSEYPESLAASIHITGDTCAAKAPNWPSIFQGRSYAVQFKVEWKNGMTLKAATLSSQPAECVGYASVPIPHQDYTIPSLVCHLTVDSKGVPLSSHLIVSVFAPDGLRLTRISAAP